MAGFLAGFGQGVLDYSNQLNQNAYRQALLQLNQQNQQLRARQMLAELANQRRLQAAQAQIGQAFSREAAQPGGGSAGAGPIDFAGGGLPSGGSPGPALPQSFPQVPNATGAMADNSAALGLISRDESGGRNIPNYRFDAGHTASGPLQITDTTWNRYAPSVGAPPLQYPASPKDRPLAEQYKVGGAIFNKEGFAPWANFNPKLAADLKNLNLPPEAQQQGSQIAVGAAGMLPPQMIGRGGPDIFARAVERIAGSDAPDEVKGAALMQLLPLMSQEGQRSFQQAFEMYRLGVEQSEKGREFGIRTQELEANRAQTREFAQQRLDMQQQALDIKKGQQEATLPDDTVRQMAEQYLAGDRTIMQNLGRGAQGAANIVKLRGEIAKQLAEKGVSGTEMATRIAEFEGLKAGERTLGTRTAQMGLAVNELEAMLPVALEASDKVDRTQYPTLNSLLLAGERGTGDENVVRLSAATNSLLNVYARAVTPSGQPTEGAQKRAREVLDQAYSQGQYRAAVDQMLKEVRAAQQSPGATRQEFRRQTDPGSSLGAPATGDTGKNKVGDIIVKGGRRWRVIGGDPNDPDVEPAQ